MPIITIDVSREVAEALDQQARGLLLRRNMYLRALLAAVAAQAQEGHKRPGTLTPRPEPRR